MALVCGAQTVAASLPADTVLQAIIVIAEVGFKAEGEGDTEGEGLGAVEADGGAKGIFEGTTEGVEEGAGEGAGDGEIDTVRPTATLSTSGTYTVLGAKIVNLVLSEDAADISVSVITAQNALVSDFSGSTGTQFTFTLTPLLHGPFSASIAENQFFDAAGNGNIASNVLSKSFDSRPRGTFSVAPKNPVYGAITVTLEVSEFIPNISSSALTLLNATTSELSSFAGTQFTFELAPIVPGEFSVSIAANQFSDAEGNGNKSTGLLTRHYVEWVEEEAPEVDYPTGDAVATKLTSQLSTQVGRSVSIDGDRLLAGGADRALGWTWSDGAWLSNRVFSNWSTYESGSSTYEVALTGFSAYAVAVLDDNVILGSPYPPHQRWPKFYFGGAINRYLWDEPSLGFEYKTIGANSPRYLGQDVALAEWKGNTFYFATEPVEGRIYSNQSWESTILGIEKVDAWQSIVLASAPGAAYAYNATGDDWTSTYRETMTVDGGVEADDFGADVSVHGRTALVSAPGENEGTGAVYVFVQGESGWTQQARLAPDDGAAGDAFGQSVAVWGNTAIVAAPHADGEEGIEDAGAVYMFRRISGVWAQIAKLVAPDPDAGDNFGHAVDSSATDIAVGAPGDDELGTDAGAVYVYTGGFINEAVRESIEGVSDGEGSAEGLLEGTIEGIIEGTMEGTAEGLVEGMSEGLSEGLAEGLLEGELEGVAEGEVSSDGEGADVVEGAIDGEGGHEGEGLNDGEGAHEGEVSHHSLDIDGDNMFELTELLRGIQLYNSGAFGCEEDSEDGYTPESSVIQCAPHAGDYHPQDWIISLSELLRLIQLYNIGSIIPCITSEDGFCPSA